MKRGAVWGITIFALVALAATVTAFTCPYTGDTSPAEYSRVEILPPEKYVGKKFTISIIDVYQKEDREEPAKDRLVLIYLLVNNKTVSDYSVYTDSNGEATFKPEDSGHYAVATSGRYIFFDVLSRCGDDRCTSGETRTNCPEDCSTCGDRVCDPGEDKENCPKDCIVCGDDVCDPGENRANCPDDCARCGDNVCDINENKKNCPEDCVICGDGVCDCQEITGLHETTCPEDCVKCGDDVCDTPYEDAITCAQDCNVCGDEVCGPSENVTCPQDCAVCGNGECETGENKTSCAKDCVVCGDSVCDPQELIGLHETTCAQDCNVCGDKVCDYGESKTCPNDCKNRVEGILLGYFMIPIALVILVILFEITRHYWGARKAAERAAALEKAAPKRIKLVKMKATKVLPYFVIFSVSLVAMSVLLYFLGLNYSKNLAILDVGSFLLENGALISLIVIALAAGIGILARATYYMERSQAIALSMGFGFIGAVPGLGIFMSIEYVVLLAGLLVGIAISTLTVKREETEFAVKKPFRIGSDAADKMLTTAAVFFCILVFLQLLMNPGTADDFAKSIAGSQTTKEVVGGSLNIHGTDAEIKDQFVTPFFETDFGGISGRVVFAIAAALVVLAVVKLFIVLIKVLAGFFSWITDKSGFV